MKSAFINYKYSKIALAVFAVSNTLSTMANATVCTTLATDTNYVSCLSSATPTCGDPSITSGQCAMINSNGMVTPLPFSAAASAIGLDAFSESLSSVLSKVTHTNGNPISIELLNPAGKVGAVGVRATNKYDIYPDNMESKIDVNGAVTVKATSSSNLAWVFGLEGQSTGTKPTTINYSGALTVDTLNVPSGNLSSTVMGIKATPNLRYGVGDVLVNVADGSHITVKSNSSAQGISAEALLGKTTSSYISVDVGIGTKIDVIGAANATTAVVSLKRLPLSTVTSPALPGTVTLPPSPQLESIITFSNKGELSSSNDLVIRGESTANTTTNVTNYGTGILKGYATMGAGTDNIINNGTWAIHNCVTFPLPPPASCTPATVDLGAGINSIINNRTMTVVRTNSATDSNQATIKGGTLTMANAGTIDMQEKVPLLSDASGLLTVEGSFKTTGGTLNLDTKLAGDGAPSDILKVVGNITTTSPTTIIINDVGTPGDATATGNVAAATGGIPLIKYSGYSSPDDAFMMSNIAKGAYTYRLFNDTANQMWKLIALQCSISHSEYYPESDIKISCTGLFPGEQITIPGTTNCIPGSASATGTLTCSGKGKDIGSTPAFVTEPPANVPPSSAVPFSFSLIPLNPTCSPNPAGSLYSNEAVTVTCSGVKPGDPVTYNGVTVVADPSGNAVFPTTAGVVVTKPQATINTSPLLTLPTIQPIAVGGITLLAPSCSPSPTGSFYSNEPVTVTCSGVKPGDSVTYNGVTVIADASGKAVFPTTAGVVATTPTATIPGQPALGVTGVTLLTPSCTPSPSGVLSSNTPVIVTCSGVRPGDPVTYNGVTITADPSGKVVFPTTAGVVVANPTATIPGLGGSLPVIGISLTAAIPVNSNYVLLMLMGLLGVIGAFGIRRLPKR